MDCGEPGGPPARPERFVVTGRLVRYQLVAIGRKAARRRSICVLTVDVARVFAQGAPDRAMPDWREVLRAPGGLLELRADPTLTGRGMRRGETVRIVVERDGPWWRLARVLNPPASSVCLQGRICEVRPDTTLQMAGVAIRLDVHDVFAADPASGAAELPAEWSLRPWFVGPWGALSCDVRVGQTVTVRASLRDGRWRIDQLDERRPAAQKAARRRTSSG